MTLAQAINEFCIIWSIYPPNVVGATVNGNGFIFTVKYTVNKVSHHRKINVNFEQKTFKYIN